MTQRTILTLGMLPLLTALSLGDARDPRPAWPVSPTAWLPLSAVSVGVPVGECDGDDAVCAAISRMLNARSNGFLHLRGDRSGEDGQGNVSAIGMTCDAKEDETKGPEYECMEIALSPERVTTMYLGLTAAVKRAI